MIIEQYIDDANNTRILWQTHNGEIIMLKFSKEPSENELLNQEELYYSTLYEAEKTANELKIMEAQLLWEQQQQT